MRWQKIARFAIAVFVLGFGAFVFLAMRQRVAVSSGDGDAAKVDPNLVMSSGPGKRQDTKFGKLNQDLAYEKALTYKDGRTVLLGVKLTLPDRNGRSFLITADEGESLAPPDKPLDLSGAKLRGHVKLTTDNGLEVLANDATYDKNEGLVKVPGPVTFTRGRMKGSGVGATYDENRDVLWLLAEARLTVTPDAAGGGAVEATSAKAGLARAENFVKLEGTAHLTADSRTADADVITAYLDEKGEKIQRMELREHSRITGTGAGAQTMTARHIDMIYAADGLYAARLEAHGRGRDRVPRGGRRHGPADRGHDNREHHVARRCDRRQPDRAGEGPGRSAGRGRDVRQADPFRFAPRYRRGGAGSAKCGVRRQRRLLREPAGDW